MLNLQEASKRRLFSKTQAVQQKDLGFAELELLFSSSSSQSHDAG